MHKKSKVIKVIVELLTEFKGTEGKKSFANFIEWLIKREVD